MTGPALLELEFPDLPPDAAPPPPVQTLEQWAEWLEENRALQDRQAFEAWLSDPDSLPRGERFWL